MAYITKGNLCRLCLYKSDSLIYIFEDVPSHEPVVSEVISDLLHYDVYETDGYPQFVCPYCLDKLNDFKIFKKQCSDSKDALDREYTNASISEEFYNPLEVNFIPAQIKQEVDTYGNTDVQQQVVAENDQCSKEGTSYVKEEGEEFMEDTKDCNSNRPLTPAEVKLEEFIIHDDFNDSEEIPGSDNDHLQVTTPIEKKKLRGAWSQNDLQQAMEAVKRGMSTYKAESQFGIPRRTLRRYVEFGVPFRTKRGHSSILTRKMPKQCVAVPTEKKKARGGWSQNDLQQAMDAVMRGMSTYKAEIQFGVPRRTLRRYVDLGVTFKSKMGRSSVLSRDQDAELRKRIISLADVGYPLTTQVLKLCIYKFLLQNNVKAETSILKAMAGRELPRFLARNGDIADRKAESLNKEESVGTLRLDLFKTLRSAFGTKPFWGKQERLYNMVGKGFRFNLRKEEKDFHNGLDKSEEINEQEQYVNVIACANAYGSSIPPMILLKGKCTDTEYSNNLPSGSLCRMTPDGNVNTKAFIDWIHHFVNFKDEGPCLLIFDGTDYQLDYEIVEVARGYNITLFYLPSEIQPLYKTVLGSWVTFWDENLLPYWNNNGEKLITKQCFGEVLSKMWEKCMNPVNIRTGFSATGIYSFNLNYTPHETYALDVFIQRPITNVSLPGSSNLRFNSVPICDEHTPLLGESDEDIKPNVLSSVKVTKTIF